MRSYTNLFLINGRPMLAPDEDVGVSYADLDADDSGRDETGYMHRIVVRYKLGTWSFEYASITEAEKRYLEELFGEMPDFDFTHPDRLNAEKQVTVKAYRSKYNTSWHNARTGQWRKHRSAID